MLSSSVMIRRFCSFKITASSSTITSTTKKKRLVFLGSPQVSASVLDALFNASAAPDSLFEITAIVTQPPSGRDRGRKVMPSPVAQHALDRGFPSDLIFTPVKAGEEAFLFNFKSLEPELCVTAAYGNILPTKFLNIPSKAGTVNIHPSLLPLYRGAAPVQRALQDGVKETGVSLAYTVRKLDAGPVIACERVTIDDQIKVFMIFFPEILFLIGFVIMGRCLIKFCKSIVLDAAPDLLDLLFDLGSKLLIRELPSIFDGSANGIAEEQDDSKATLAPKITPEESWLSFDEDAQVLHNKVFFSIVFQSGLRWPGTRARLKVIDPSNGESSIIELKIITTRIYGGIRSQDIEAHDVLFTKGSLVIPCGGGTALEVLEIQLPGKRAVNAASFWNGLRGQMLKKL
ncbi:hypothetical protein H5410_008906 [Solanum commersonii]|uniref:Methionyl-tRNA formyltransferase, mitochondrial n=1 Tax=Solanum commersonii TaxID=4109 RepID=A0A9J6AGH9_SOLCO|nr:hypothetical protein H5410_008906 [Solanum commersonii]